MAMAFQLKKMIVLKVIFVVQILNLLEVRESSPVIKQPAKCSRPQSKFVREYFARSLLPIYQSYGVPVPEKCPFSPLYDIYHYHENNKTKSDTHKWKCEICGKYFTSEPFLDNHFDRRHKDSLQLNENSVCLGSYCRIFRCDFLMAMESRRKPPDTKCYESIMQTLNKKCKSHLDLCIPRGIPFNIQNKLTVELRENLCSYLTCSRINELPSYMSNGPNFFIVFIVVIFLGLCIIAYGVINHTDLIFDENEEVEPINFEANIEIPKVQTKKAKKQQQQPIIDTNNYTSQTAKIEKLNDLSSKYKYIDRLSTELRRRNNASFFTK